MIRKCTCCGNQVEAKRDPSSYLSFENELFRLILQCKKAIDICVCEKCGHVDFFACDDDKNIESELETDALVANHEEPVQIGKKAVTIQRGALFNTDGEYKFPAYQRSDAEVPDHLSKEKYQEYVKSVVDVEAPISEKEIQDRTVKLFGNDKVTKKVKTAYAEYMQGCDQIGIIRRKGFLYREGQTVVSFRIRTDGKLRKIEGVAPEELASGLFAIIEKHGTLGKDTLYREMVGLLGYSRLTENCVRQLETILLTMTDRIEIAGNVVGIK